MIDLYLEFNHLHLVTSLSCACRMREPTDGHFNRGLELDEEDIWRGKALGV